MVASGALRTPDYEDSVFVNCPFDDDYRELFLAIVFAIHDCGFVARCALEASDSGEVRIAKILDIIGACKFGVHDISRTELGPKTKLPRFNMPLELGLFLGAKAFGRRNPRQKVCLILDRQPYRYQKFCSDIAGQDLAAHGGQPKRAIKAVRDWLQANHRSVIRPDGTTIHHRYRKFVQALPELRRQTQLDKDEPSFVDYVSLLEGWLEQNDWAAGRSP
jgi:hypothetical protein